MKTLKKHIHQELTDHRFDYFFLVISSVFFLGVLITLQGNTFGQFITIASYIIFYLLWSLIHHYQTGTLKYKIMLEYILISATMLFILKILLLK
jgi:hypothetical protein